MEEALKSSYVVPCLANIELNQVVWAPVARSSFQGRTREIPGSNSKGNNS